MDTQQAFIGEFVGVRQSNSERSCNERLSASEGVSNSWWNQWKTVDKKARSVWALPAGSTITFPH